MKRWRIWAAVFRASAVWGQTLKHTLIYNTLERIPCFPPALYSTLQLDRTNPNVQKDHTGQSSASGESRVTWSQYKHLTNIHRTDAFQTPHSDRFPTQRKCFKNGKINRCIMNREMTQHWFWDLPNASWFSLEWILSSDSNSRWRSMLVFIRTLKCWWRRALSL